MRVIYLSDHVGLQLTKTEQQYEAVHVRLGGWQSARQRAGNDAGAARWAKPWWKILLFISTPQEQEARARSAEAERQIGLARQEMDRLDQRKQQLSAGADGENFLVEGLSVLSEEWVMLCGYRNRRGEADHVLVGPTGIWVAEGKYRRVRVTVTGDRWWFEKLDNWGNMVDEGPATDRSGRSWARQANDVAQDLSRWLARNGYRYPVSTAVMLTHHQAEVGECRDLTVNLVGSSPEHLLEELRGPAWLSPDDRAEVVRLIERDHHFHNQSGQRRRRR
ncbi:nuclease-related domain-containing protein [Micromonospora sp. RTGN7]|uniref:nuclease-related domain-containing protein n=1 Tax=Micromonospora sp. RTGN7 TaxID=3016526 RepID=UPI0029FF345C|nr:nuclease-related domain-containing protein [Micromonospora sp. RTGN7]